MRWIGLRISCGPAAESRNLRGSQELAGLPAWADRRTGADLALARTPKILRPSLEALLESRRGGTHDMPLAEECCHVAIIGSEDACAIAAESRPYKLDTKARIWIPILFLPLSPALRPPYQYNMVIQAHIKRPHYSIFHVCSIPVLKLPFINMHVVTSSGPSPYLTSGAAAAAMSLLISVAPVSAGRPSNILLHHPGGSSGRWPLCKDG